MGKLDGKTALVTGSSRGIGAVIAKTFAREGARVIVNYAASKDRAEQVAAEIEAAGGQALLAPGDVTDLSQIDAMFAGIKRQVDRIDILVNNAGRGGPQGFPDLDKLTSEAYDQVFNLNVRGLLFVTQGAVRLMPDNGRIIMVSSMAARIRMPGLAIYAASKAAVDAFTRNLAMELAPRGITINSMNVGTVETELTGRMEPETLKRLVSMIPMGRIGQPRDIADVATFLASEESRWITGECIAVAGGRYI
jgi:3-oxoacyl-[acyl-carrier protein] reductase